jgi:uncharacterized protein YqhQ
MPESTFHYGGQAVIEGVMMRGRRAMAVAVRDPDGQVHVHEEPLDRGFYASPWAKRPFVRGVLLLWDTLVLGTRALTYSATVAAGEAAGPAAQAAFSGGLLWGTLAIALVFAVAVFFVSPLLLTGLVESLLPHAALSVVVEGLIRIALFFGYIWLIGRVPDVRRVFAYHGAEHKAINAFEAGEPLRTDRVDRYSVAHPRCGTSFLLYVVILSIFVFAMLGHPPLPLRVASRVVFVPVIASVAYEMIRLSGRRSKHPVVKALLAPGMALQALTTREPDDDQVEVAIAALGRVLEVDGVQTGAAQAGAVHAADAADAGASGVHTG